MSDNARKSGQRSSEQAFCYRQRGPAHPIAGAMFCAALVAMAVFSVAAQWPIAPAPAVTPTRSEPIVSRSVQRARFFDAEVEPRITETDLLNRQAADRCVARLRTVLDGYHAGVDPFVEDLTSISTRLGIVRRMPGNWWKEDKRIEAYVQEKFETHLFSEAKLLSDVAQVLDDFRSEIDAHQKRMLTDVRASLDTADLPEVTAEEYAPFFAAVADRLRDYTTEQGTTSVYNALTVLIVSELGYFTARSLVAGLLARFGSAAAVSATVGVGATAGATATGAGGGSLVGPVGTIVGLGVGLAVGLIIDWWMTERFEAEISVQMNGYLDSLEATLLHGSVSVESAAGGGRFHQHGLVDALPLVCDQLACAYRERFYAKIVTGETAR